MRRVAADDPPAGNEPDPRFTFANERTFLAWNRTALALIAGGLAVAQFFDEGSRGSRLAIAAPLVLLGAALALTSHGRWQANQRALRLGEPLPESGAAARARGGGGAGGHRGRGGRRDRADRVSGRTASAERTPAAPASADRLARGRARRCRCRRSPALTLHASLAHRTCHPLATVGGRAAAADRRGRRLAPRHGTLPAGGGDDARRAGDHGHDRAHAGAAAAALVLVARRSVPCGRPRHPARTAARCESGGPRVVGQYGGFGRASVVSFRSGGTPPGMRTRTTRHAPSPRGLDGPPVRAALGVLGVVRRAHPLGFLAGHGPVARLSIRSRSSSGSRRARGSAARNSRRTATKRAGSSRWGKWPAPSKTSRRLPGRASCAARPWATGIDAVALAPDQQRGDAGGEVEAVAGVDALAAGVDDRAHRVQEGRAGLAVGQRGVGAGELVEVRWRAAGRRVRAGAPRARPPHRAATPRAPAARARRPGSAAARRSSATSRPRPPLETSTRRSRRSGNW